MFLKNDKSSYGDELPAMQLCGFGFWLWLGHPLLLVVLESFTGKAEVEKVSGSEHGNVVPRNFFGLKFSQKVFEKILRLEQNFQNLKLYFEHWE